jgi:hypothetical protein
VTVAPNPKRHSLIVEAVVSVAFAVAVAALGLPLGLLWRAVAPKVELVQTAYGPYPLEPEPEGYIADDGWFIFLAVGAGIVLALLAWFALRRFRGPALMAALALGSVVGSVLAAWFGHRVGLPAYQRTIAEAQVGSHFFRQPNLRLTDVGLWFGVIPRVRGIVLIQALVATALYTACAGFNYSPTLQPYDERAEIGPGMGPGMGPAGAGTGFSSGLPAWPAQTAAPAPPAPAEAGPFPDAGWRARPEDG